MESFEQRLEAEDMEHESQNKKVAVFIMKKEAIVVKRYICENKKELEDARKEFEFASKLMHPGICPALAVHEEEESEKKSRVYITFARMIKSLERDIVDHSDKPEDDATHYYEESVLWSYLQQLVSVFKYLQEQGVSHRDIKPGNILIAPDGSLKVCDFGISKHVEGIDANTLAGTVKYFSPKLREKLIEGIQMDAIHHCPYKSDVYSLGMTMLHLSAIEIPEPLAQMRNLSQSIEDCIRNDVDTRYSPEWSKILRRMLIIPEEGRPDFIELDAILNKPKQFDDDDPVQPSIVEGNVLEPVTFTLRYGLSYARVRSNESDEIPCMLSVKGTEIDPSLRLYTLDLVCVVDESGSMEGERLFYTRISLHKIVDKLSERDRMCLIGFSDDARRLCPLTACTEAGKAVLHREIENLRERDLTNITDGFTLALKVIRNRRMKNSSVSLLLISDGEDNIEANALERCISALEQEPIEKLSVYCFGISPQLDVNLLGELASRGNGDYRYIQNLDNMHTELLGVLNLALTIVARDIRLQMTINPNLPLKFKVNKIGKEESFFHIPTLSAEETRDCVFEIQPTPTKLVNRVRFAPLKFDVTFKDGENVQTEKSFSDELKFSPWSDAPPPQTKNVFEALYQAKGCNCLIQVRDHIRAKDFERARKRLAQGLEELSSSSYSSYPRVAKTIDDMNSAKALLAPEIAWDAIKTTIFENISTRYSVKYW